MFADERKKSVNATRNMMAAISVTMSSGSFGFSSLSVFCGCWRYRDDDCTELWQMTTDTVVGLTFRSHQLFLPYNRNIRP